MYLPLVKPVLPLSTRFELSLELFDLLLITYFFGLPFLLQQSCLGQSFFLLQLLANVVAADADLLFLHHRTNEILFDTLARAKQLDSPVALFPVFTRARMAVVHATVPTSVISRTLIAAF